MTSSRRLLAKAFGILALLFATSLPVVAHAERTAQDIASARQLYNDGLALRDEGDMKGALEKFRAAHALGNTPITGIELCRAYSALSQPVEAREVCLAIGRIAPLPEESQRSKDARLDAARLADAEKARIGAIRVRIHGVPQGWQPTVSVDGALLPAAALNEPRAVNPGVHSVTAKVGSGPETRATVETREGEIRDLELTVAPPPEGEHPEPVAAPPVVAPPPPKKKNTFATVSFVVAGVSAGVGALGGVIAISRENQLSDSCANKLCGRDRWDALDTARTWGNVSTVSFVIAGVALTAGIVSTLTSSSARASSAARASSEPGRTAHGGATLVPVIGLGGAGIHGSF